MPKWLTLILEWGGVAVVVISAIALIYVEMVMPTPEAGATPGETAAPITLYWVLLVIGSLGRASSSTSASGVQWSIGMRSTSGSLTIMRGTPHRRPRGSYVRFERPGFVQTRCRQLSHGNA